MPKVIVYNDDRMVNLAIKKGCPSWWAELAVEGFSKKQLEKIRDNTTEEQNLKFIGKMIPELRNKIRYRYRKWEPKERSVIRNRFNTLLRTNLLNNNIQARTLTESMVRFLMGYSLDEFIAHIEKQFINGMTWDNQGSVWHLDHIYPCARLKYKTMYCENFQRLWGLDNLRPLDAKENIRKGANVPT